MFFILNSFKLKFDKKYKWNKLHILKLSDFILKYILYKLLIENDTLVKGFLIGKGISKKLGELHKLLLIILFKSERRNI